MPTFTDEHRSARILIVDDQQSNLRLLEFTLRRAGYVAVSSTAEAVEVRALHRRNHYDLILLDLQMPRMNGFEVMAALREGEDAPVAVLVLSADPSQTLPALEAGAADFLGKPFDLNELLLRVRCLLEKAMPETPAVPAAPATEAGAHTLQV